MRHFQFALLSVVLVLAAQSVVAATYYVGAKPSDCPHPPDFSSIQTAVNTVPAGSIINVCPDTYAEQITITQALTLQSIPVNNSKQAIITVPGGGLATTSSISIGTTVAAQVEVTTGPVNITGITVDGTATSNCPSGIPYTGIFYSSGSSGTVNEVETRNQNCNGLGIGIIAENGAGAAQLVTIGNSDVNSFTYAGIWACSDVTPTTLTASIKGNNVTGGQYGVLTSCNAGGVSTNAGSVSGNNITAVSNLGVYAASTSSAISGNSISAPAGNYGIYVYAPAAISGNTVNNGAYGIVIGAPGSITSNHISNVGTGGIVLGGGAAGTSIKTNIITQAPVGIEFNCFSATVSGNTVNGAATGIDTVPAAFTGVNTFYNVATVRTNGAC
jgi:hypothetical protein